MLRILTLAVALVVFQAVGATGQNLDKGFDAYIKGNYGIALREWLPFAKAGDAGAQFMLGYLYANGLGVPEDDVEAVRWFKYSAEQGNPGGQYELGRMYWIGAGVSKDETKAAHWFRLAAEQGLRLAHASLGSMYASGNGVPEDHVIGHMWLNLAAAKGDASAAKAKDILIKGMTRAQIAEAQKLARECLARNYKGC